MATAERERDLERFLTFLDAIVAIAITLLVLPLVDLAGEVGDGSVAHLVHENSGQLWAFLLSFVVIADLWLLQHRLLRDVVAADSALERLLMLWAVTIVFLPFPTALVAGSGASDQALTKLLYVGTIAISSLTLALVATVVRRHPELRETGSAEDPTRFFTTFGVFVLILVLMLAVPPLSYWPLLLLFAQGRMRRFTRSRTGD